jgi:hypothetical protein
MIKRKNRKRDIERFKETPMPTIYKGKEENEYSFHDNKRQVGCKRGKPSLW